MTSNSIHNPFSHLSDAELAAQIDLARTRAHRAPKEMYVEATGGLSLRPMGGTFAIRSKEYFALLSEHKKRAAIKEAEAE
jgi:hypothetical protein